MAVMTPFEMMIVCGAAAAALFDPGSITRTPTRATVGTHVACADTDDKPANSGVTTMICNNLAFIVPLQNENPGKRPLDFPVRLLNNQHS